MFHGKSRALARRLVVAVVNCAMLASFWPAGVARAQDIRVAPTTSLPTSPTAVSGGTAPLQPASFAYPRLPIKDATRFRADAARYDRAVAEIAKIAAMPLDTPDALKAAMATVERHRVALRFASSKLVVLALDDRTFTGAFLRRVSTDADARSFARELIADSKAIMKLDGAAALQSRFVAAMKSDAEKVQGAARAMASSAKKHGLTVDDVLVGAMNAATFVLLLTPVVLLAAILVFPPGAVAASMIASVAIGAALSVFATIMVAAIVGGTLVGGAMMIASFAENVSSEEGRDAISDCVRGADRALSSCLKDAADDVLAEFAKVACYAKWTMDAAACLVR